MYIYSIIVLVLGLYLSPYIRDTQAPLQNLALAWIYVLDSLINAVSTALFGLSWFILLAQHLTDGSDGPAAGKLPVPGSKMMNDTAGALHPAHPVSKVDVIATPKADSILPGQDAVTVGHEGSALDQAVFQAGSVMSITVISVLWLFRIYFCLIVMAYARGMLRQYVISSSHRSGGAFPQDAAEGKNLAENPFRVGREEGEGWKGKLGRILTAFPKTYWLGKDDEDEWVRGAGDKFRSARATGGTRLPAPGVGERERRARSGTGPPAPLKMPA